MAQDRVSSSCRDLEPIVSSQQTHPPFKACVHWVKTVRFSVSFSVIVNVNDKDIYFYICSVINLKVVDNTLAPKLKNGLKLFELFSDLNLGVDV